MDILGYPRISTGGRGTAERRRRAVAGEAAVPEERAQAEMCVEYGAAKAHRRVRTSPKGKGPSRGPRRVR